MSGSTIPAPEELAAQAEEAGVAALYQHAITRFGAALRQYTVASGVGVQAQIDGGWRAVISFMPGDSRPGELHYCVYENRYAAIAQLTAEEAEALMPAADRRKPYLPDNPDFAGYEGTITSTGEIDRLVQPLRTGSRSSCFSTSTTGQ